MIALSRKPGKLDTGLIGRGLEDFRTAPPSNFSRVALRNLMRYLVAVFRGGLSWNCCALLRPVGRASRSRCLRKQRNDRKRVRLSMFRILSTPFSLAAAGVELPRLLWIRCGETGNRGPGSQGVFVLCSCGQRNRKNSQSRFREQEANASTWLAASA